jgi:hypothetical protein
MSILSLIPVWFVLALLIPIVWALAGAYRRARGQRPIVCPQAGQSAVIALDRRDAALMHILGNPPRRIEFCSRWPEDQDCARDCLASLKTR